MCVDGMATVDLAVNVILPKPWDWPEFYSYARTNFVLRDDSWNPAGAGAPGNGSLPYGKVMHSIYLLTYAIRNEYIPQWHSREDYLAAANGLAGQYHDWLEYQFRNRASPGARAFESDHKTELYCPMFNRGATFDDPASRASVMVHEGWHHWQRKYGWEGGHVTGGSVAQGTEGDWFYPHGTGAFEFGWLWSYDLTSNPMRFHSPTQIQCEYLADLAEFSHSWVPVAVTDQARAIGNNLLASRFKNATSYRIGQPRPF